MLQEKIPIVTDPDSFETGQAISFPCSTQYMRYNGLLHKYYLTLEALQKYGIDVEDSYISSSPERVNRFIEEVTEDVYGVIMKLAPFNYQFNSYLIAQSITRQYPDKYTARKQFERALIYQAEYKIINIDVRDINGIDIENGNSIYHKQLRKELRHVSPKALDILQGLGLLFNGYIPGKHLVNYNTMM